MQADESVTRIYTLYRQSYSEVAVGPGAFGQGIANLVRETLLVGGRCCWWSSARASVGGAGGDADVLALVELDRHD